MRRAMNQKGIGMNDPRIAMIPRSKIRHKYNTREKARQNKPENKQQ